MAKKHVVNISHQRPVICEVALSSAMRHRQPLLARAGISRPLGRGGQAHVGDNVRIGRQRPLEAAGTREGPRADITLSSRCRVRPPSAAGPLA